MLTSQVQRWEGRRSRFRPAHEVIRPSEYEVAALEEKTAKAFVIEHHYSRTYPAARFRFGLWRRGRLVGVAVYSHPMNDAALAIFPGGPRDSTELGRFVLADEVPGNGETWFLARTFEELRRAGLAGILSFSDPEPTTAADGQVVFGGHVGVIYQAHNAAFLGRSSARTHLILPDGRRLSPRALAKIRNGDKGWRYASAQLEAFGVPPLETPADGARWLREVLPRITRPRRHAGNYRYAWALQPRLRKVMPVGMPYPRFDASLRRVA